MKPKPDRRGKKLKTVGKPNKKSKNVSGGKGTNGLAGKSKKTKVLQGGVMEGETKKSVKKKSVEPVSFTRKTSSNENSKVVINTDGGKWFEQKILQDEAGTVDGNEEEKPLLMSEVNTIENAALKYLEADVEAYTTESLNGSNRQDFLWMNKLLKTGTLPDRMAAYTVRIQNSPVHNLQCLQQLIGQVKVQGKQHCLTTAETVKELFLQDLLPPDRKLMSFADHGSALRKAPKNKIILWVFEDRLKKCYATYVESLNRMSSDTVDTLRGKAISIMQQLITSHPEQENALLPMLVNKLGDTVPKIASRASYHLKLLVKEHPRMKIVVVDEVERLIFRNNVGSRAQYYGICYLNTIPLQEEHPKLAAKLIKVYLAFFKGCVKTGEIDSKMMSALLTGVNKSFKQAQTYGVEVAESVDTLYKIVNLSQFNIGIQALSLLQQMVDVKDDLQKADRFYRVLYEHLMRPELGVTAHGMNFLNVLFRALKTDSNVLRVTAFTKRLMQICHHVPANVACGILFLLSEISKEHRGIFKLGTVVTPATNKEDLTNVDQESQVNSEKQEKILKRLTQKTNIVTDGGSSSSTPAPKNGNSTSRLLSNSIFPPKDSDIEITAEIKTEVKLEPGDVRTTTYNILGRNPAYCGAHLTSSYELVSLATHYHPSVALFAQNLLEKTSIKYDGNPLRDFTVARFLERFIYKNPKVNKLHPQYEPRGLRKVPVNSSAYLEAKFESIPVEERFFYKYFKDHKKKPTRKDDDSDNESVGDDEFDELMSNYFKQTGAIASDDEDEEDDNIDFVADLKSRKGKKGRADDEEDEDEDDDGDQDVDMDGAYDGSDLDDEEAIDADDFIELGGEDEDFDDELDDMMEDFEDDEDKGSKKLKKMKKPKGDNMFLPAEQFSEMLDENADVDLASSHTFINKDRADMKQLKWESERDRWVKGYKRSSKINLKSLKSKKKRF